MDMDVIVGFDWDEGNFRKNLRHGVSHEEAEQVFLNQPLVVSSDATHSQKELRYNALGRTHADRWLHVTFTLRGKSTLIRVISARDMSRKERLLYEQEKNETDS